MREVFRRPREFIEKVKSHPTPVIPILLLSAALLMGGCSKEVQLNPSTASKGTTYATSMTVDENGNVSRSYSVIKDGHGVTTSYTEGILEESQMKPNGN